MHVQTFRCNFAPESKQEMKITEVSSLLQGHLLTCRENPDLEIHHAFASDLMSDVLTVKTYNLLLITGLVNIQVIRTAEMSDICCLVIARGKQVTPEMINLAEETGIAIISSPFSLFKTSGLLFQAGVKPVY